MVSERGDLMKAKSKLSHYVTLLLIVLLGFWGFMYFRFDRTSQGIIILLTSGAYVLWGIFHHLFCEDLHLKIVIEYVLIAFFVAISALSLLFWA